MKSIGSQIRDNVALRVWTEVEKQVAYNPRVGSRAYIRRLVRARVKGQVWEKVFDKVWDHNEISRRNNS